MSLPPNQAVAGEPAPDLPPVHPTLPGRWLVVGLLGLAAVAAGYAWWHHWARGRQALVFWGADAALLIRTSPSVTFLTLGPLTAADQQPLPTHDHWLQLPGQQQLPVVKLQNAAVWAGLPHLRQALIDDRSFTSFDVSFAINTPAPSPSHNAGHAGAPTESSATHPHWTVALQFGAPPHQVTLPIDPQAGYLLDLRQGRVAQLNPFVADGLRRYLAQEAGLPRINQPQSAVDPTFQAASKAYNLAFAITMAQQE